MHFRRAEACDADRIAQLHAESWRRTYRGMMRDEFLDGDVLTNRCHAWRDLMTTLGAGKLVLLAEDGAHLAGFICVTGDEDVLWGSYVNNLHVATSHMRRGVGKALMGHAARWLRDSYARSSIYLWVMQRNDRARRFYEALGAANVGERSLLDPGGGSALNCRYVWRRPEDLLRACDVIASTTRAPA
jgi:ribosomal protein S18 acetylase RimI-like enzyme